LGQFGPHFVGHKESCWVIRAATKRGFLITHPKGTRGLWG